MNSIYAVKVVYPLKQGLKLCVLNYFAIIHRYVKVVYPLKQGLKRFAGSFHKSTFHNVKVVYPLKQGLKLPISRYYVDSSIQLK